MKEHEMTPSMTGQGVMIATHYREGAVLAIAREAARRGRLTRLYTTLHTARAQRVTSLLPRSHLRRGLERQLRRSTLPGIPEDRVRCVAVAPEAARVIALRIPHAQALAEWWNYRVKERFDRAVAQRLDREHWDAVVAMFASAEHIFQVARRMNRLGVLNFVNSHPIYQNRFLKELAGLTDGHHELVPADVSRRVDRELELADLVLVPSLFVARQLYSLGVRPEKVAIEPYGVDLSAFHPRSRIEADEERNRPRRCLYVGSVSHRKGIRVLLEAARQLQNHPLEFVLIGPLWSPEILQDAPANVRWLGKSVQDGIAEAMRHVDMFVLPSVDDAYPLVTMEAMASGLPVVLSNHAGTSELITDGVDGCIVPAGDTNALTTAISRLAEDETLRTSIGQAARKRVEDGHSWKDYGGRVLDVMERFGNVRLRPVSGPVS